MANIRKLWALKTSLRGIANTEGTPDQIVPDSFFWTTDPSTGFTPYYRYYTGGGYTTNDPSPFLWSIKNTFYEDSPRSEYDSYYGTLQEFDYTAFFRRTQTVPYGGNNYMPYTKVLPGFDYQMFTPDPYYDVSYTSNNGNEIPSYFQKFFAGSLIQAFEDDDFSYAQSARNIPDSSSRLKGYGWWYRNTYPFATLDLRLNTPLAFEQVRFSPTVPDVYSLQANYYVQSWQSSISGVWNEYEGAELTASPQIPYLDKYWYGGTISDSEKEQMALKGKPRLQAPVSDDPQAAFPSGLRDETNPLYEAGGTNIAFEIELALHRYGAAYTTEGDNTVFGVDYVAGNFAFSSFEYTEHGQNILVPCYVTLEPNEDVYVTNNYFGDTGVQKTSQVAYGHVKRYVIVAIRLEQTFNVESFVPGSGIVLDPERLEGTYAYANQTVGGFRYGTLNPRGRTDNLFPSSNDTEIFLNNGVSTSVHARPVNCFRMSESGDHWYWSGGSHIKGNNPSDKTLFKANPGSFSSTSGYDTGPRNMLFLGKQADPQEGHQIYYANWTNTISSVVPHERIRNPYVDDTNRVNYGLLELDLDFKIQAFQWSNCGEWLYILYTSGAQPNTDSSSYVYQWVERYWSNTDISTSGAGNQIDFTTGGGEGSLEWAGSTDIHYIYGNGDPDYPTLYPAHSINITPDGQYLQVLFDYFYEGHPTISEHFIGGDPHLMVNPKDADYWAYYSKYSGFSRSTTPRCYTDYSAISTADEIRWPVATIKPGYVGDDLTTAQQDAGQTEVYLRLGTAYYSVNDYAFAYPRRNTVGAEAQETIKTWPTDFAWSVDGTELHLFGFLDRTLYADQYPSGYSTRYGMWEMNDGAPVMWKVKLYKDQEQYYQTVVPLTQYPGQNTDYTTYPNREATPYLYNNRIYYSWRWHKLKQSAGLESGGAAYFPTCDYEGKQLNIKIVKDTYSQTGTTEYKLSPLYGAANTGTFFTVSYSVFSKQEFPTVINTVDYASSNSFAAGTRGIAFSYRFDLSDPSMSGDGINVYDINGLVWTQGVSFGGIPGQSGAHMTIRLDPWGGTWPTALFVYGSASSGPNDSANPGFAMMPREVPKFHYATHNLTENGASNTGDIWPEYPLRVKGNSPTLPVNWAYSDFGAYGSTTQPAVFNLAKNGRFINIACAILEGNHDGTNGEVQRINTWLIEDQGDENWEEARYGGVLGPNEFIGHRYSGYTSPIAPYSGRSRWGNSIHFTMDSDKFMYTPVQREVSVDRSPQQWWMINRGQSENRADFASMIRTSFREVGSSRFNGQVDFDWQGDSTELSGDSAPQHWPYPITSNGDLDPLVAFNDRRGGFESLWLVGPQQVESFYTGWQQSGLFYWGNSQREDVYYEDGPFQRRYPSLIQYYEDQVESGRFLDLSDVAPTTNSELDSPDYYGTFQRYHLLNGTAISSGWRLGITNRRIDVPPFKTRIKSPQRTDFSKNANEFNVSFMDVIGLGLGSNYAVLKKKFNAPNMTQAGFAYDNSGRVELEVPYTFDSYTALDATFPATLQTLEYTSDLGMYTQAQVRSIRFLDGGNRFAVLLSGELGEANGFAVGSPAFSILMYDTAQPYSIENATYDKSFTYTDAYGTPYKRSFWQGYERQAGTYYGGDFVMKPDGTKMWVLGIESTATGFPIRPYQCALLLYEFDLSTPFDLSTVSPNGTATYANIAHNGTAIELPDNLEVSPDGLTVYWGTHAPFDSSNSILHYQSSLPNPYDLKNPDDESTRSFSYQGFQSNIVSKGNPMYAYEGAGQMMRFAGNNPDRWYRTNYANPAVGTETTPANPATGTTNYYALLRQPYGGCSVFEKGGQKYQKDPSKVSIGNMGMFPTRPFLGLTGDGFPGESQYGWGRGRRRFVSQFDKFVFAVDPEETTMVVSDGQRWLYQLLFNNDSGVRGS